MEKPVTHEEFVRLAGEAARNAQGLRPLAGHVRRLYRTIRTLQEDDNAFCYIAEVIQKARDDRTNAFDFMTRVKTYHHRDRKAVGDAPVARGLRRTEVTARPIHETAAIAEKPVPHGPRADAGGETVPVRMEGQPVSGKSPVAPDQGQAMPAAAVRDEQDAPADHRRGLTAALHNRPGRRKIVAGG